MNRDRESPAGLPHCEGLCIERVHQEPGCIKVSAVADPDLRYCRGHFPGNPIIPGFVQVYWILEAATYFGLPRGVISSFDQLKFTNPIRGGESLELDISWREDRSSLRFSISADGGPISSGKVCYEHL